MLLAVLAGSVLALHPIIRLASTSYHSAALADDMVEEHSQGSPADVRAALDRARTSPLATGNLIDPFAAEPAAPPVPVEGIGRLRIPAIGVALPIVEGTTPASLSTGAGHLSGTAVPAGGTGTHSVLAGHSGYADHRTFFDRLDELVVGDIFFIDVAGATIAYRVDQVSVVAPDDFSGIQSVEGADHVTLLTCTPFGTTDFRLLVRGARVPFSVADGVAMEVMTRSLGRPEGLEPVTGVLPTANGIHQAAPVDGTPATHPFMAAASLRPDMRFRLGMGTAGLFITTWMAAAWRPGRGRHHANA